MKKIKSFFEKIGNWFVDTWNTVAGFFSNLWYSFLNKVVDPVVDFSVNAYTKAKALVIFIIGLVTGLVNTSILFVETLLAVWASECKVLRESWFGTDTLEIVKRKKK